MQQQLETFVRVFLTEEQHETRASQPVSRAKPLSVVTIGNHRTSAQYRDTLFIHAEARESSTLGFGERNDGIRLAIQPVIGTMPPASPSRMMDGGEHEGYV